MSALSITMVNVRWLRLPLSLALALGSGLTAWTAQLALPSLPFADLYANRGELVAASGEGMANNRGATQESGEPHHAEVYVKGTVWASWTAPQTGVLALKAKGANFPVVVAAYANADDLHAAANPAAPVSPTLDNPLQEIASDAPKNAKDRNASEIEFPVHAGVPYAFAVGGLGSTAGNIEFTWKFKAAARALPVVRAVKSRRTGTKKSGIELSCDVEANGPVQYQWMQDGNPLPGKTSLTLALPELTDRDVGNYRLRITVPPQDLTQQPIIVETEGSEIQIASGDRPDGLAVNSLAAVLAQMEQPAESNGSDGETPTAGRIGDKSNLPALPVIGLTRSYSGSQVFSTAYALSDPNEPLHCGVYGGASYWYGYTPSANGTLSFDTVGSSYNTILAVYTYNAAIGGYAGLIPVACQNNQSATDLTSRVSFPAQGGVQYIVVVDGVNQARGIVRLNWLFTPLAPTILAQPASVSVTPGQSATFSVTASSSAPVTYQWRAAGVAIPGATGQTLALSSVSTTSAGRYDVLIKNAGGTVFSTPATLTVNATPPTPPTPPLPVKASLALYADGAGISCASDAGRTYQLQHRTLSGWQTLQTRTGNGGVITFTESNNSGARFFRIVAVQ